MILCGTGAETPKNYNPKHIDMADFALEREKALIATLRARVEAMKARKDGDEDGYYAQGYLETKADFRAILDEMEAV